MKNRSLKFFYVAFNSGLQVILKLKQLINRLLAEVNELKSNDNINNVSYHFEENELNERNVRSSNLIFCNVLESDSNNFVVRLAHDTNLISNVICSVISDNDNIKSISHTFGK